MGTDMVVGAMYFANRDYGFDEVTSEKISGSRKATTLPWPAVQAHIEKALRGYARRSEVRAGHLDLSLKERAAANRSLTDALNSIASMKSDIQRRLIEAGAGIDLQRSELRSFENYLETSWTDAVVAAFESEGGVFMSAAQKQRAGVISPLAGLHIALMGQKRRALGKEDGKRPQGCIDQGVAFILARALVRKGGRGGP